MTLGILGNIVAAPIIFLLGLFWKNYLGIKISNLFYQGVRIDTTWEVIQAHVTLKGYSLQMHSSYTLTLKQTAGHIKGTAMAEYGRNKAVTYYKVKGSIKDRFVSLSMTLDEKQRIAHSTMLIEVIDNGERMKGIMTFYALRSGEINAIEISCHDIGNNRCGQHEC